MQCSKNLGGGGGAAPGFYGPGLCNPIFSNKENLKPVIATKPIGRCQIDLVLFEKNPSEDEHDMFISTSLGASAFLRNTYFYKE